MWKKVHGLVKNWIKKNRIGDVFKLIVNFLIENYLFLLVILALLLSAWKVLLLLLGGIIVIVGLTLFLVFFIFLIFIFPSFLFLSSLCDIFCSRWLKNYKDNNMTKYQVPMFVYYFAVFPMFIISEWIKLYILKYSDLEEVSNILFSSEAILLMVMLLYVIVINLGMYFRLKNIDDSNFLLSVLDNHHSFLKLSFIPASFLLTILGVITIFSDIKINFRDSFAIFDRFIFFTTPLNDIVNWLKFIILIYIMAIPIQLMGLFMNNILIYYVKYAGPYKQILNNLYKSVAKFVGTLIK
ncbi:hypothetical protein G7081_03450 [Vagococcus coleopterorum]|uniref:Uncharacterized protein n=1 Tax=Vagococcus coleopterorum TaxID=2714946 RepID=A0A6G8AMN9_9ENTE|nr:hypothetical protein [Vagococcus coleopterorum]QIL46193.1 hypothetical protein G7081_03450 [Vagococcus coleopterorum]